MSAGLAKSEFVNYVNPEMRLNTFQKLVVFCMVSLALLIFIGAIVRVTGSGMGCPDWPKCWGEYIPPSSLEGIDVEKLVNHESFIREYRDHAGPDAKLTPEALRAMFNSKHTWIEYINRLFAMPIGLGALALLAYTQIRKAGNKVLLAGSYGVFLLVVLNAVVGMLVVKTGLQEGVITVHTALAILLFCLLVYLFWKGAERPTYLKFLGRPRKLQVAGWVLFILVVVEGIMGSQVRELTDALQKDHLNTPRSEWTGELENALVYLVHRSFSWGVLAAALFFGWWNLTMTARRWSFIETCVVGIVFAQMVLGLLLAQFGVFPVVQVLHIGLSSILVSSLFYWLLTAREERLKV